MSADRCSRQPAGRPAVRFSGAARAGRPTWDRGAATVWLLAVGLLLAAAGLLGATVGAAQVARHQAQVAADLGALAGAARAAEGPAAACGRAGELVTANGARLRHCELVGQELSVTVEGPAGVLAGPGRVAVASARAGPVYSAAA